MTVSVWRSAGEDGQNVKRSESYLKKTMTTYID